MKKPLKSNTFSRARDRDLAPYAAAIEGDPDAYLCALSWETPSDAAKSAIRASAPRIGYDAASFVSIGGFSAAEAFRLVEALDPVALVVLDEQAARLLEEAYRSQVRLDAEGSLLGRPIAAFASFSDDLASDRLKQRDWALLKRLRSRLG